MLIKTIKSCLRRFRFVLKSKTKSRLFIFSFFFFLGSILHLTALGPQPICTKHPQNLQMNVWSLLRQCYHLLHHPSFCTFRFSPPTFGSLHCRPTPRINRTRSPRWVRASSQRRSPHNELISAISTVMPLSANRKWHKRELSWCYVVNQASNNYVHRSAITRTAVPMETMVKQSTILAVV